MNVYDQYKTVNKKLICDEKIHFSEITGNRSDYHGQINTNRLLKYPKIGIYTGRGTSHSWLWFVEIFDRMGFYDLSFLTEANIRARSLDGLDVLAMSGGDTFAIAEGLGEKGAEKLERFIKNGGVYLGSCAGAYLPLNSSKKHLNLFNYVPVKIANLTNVLPAACGPIEKFCSSYGCSFIFHPVREDVRLTTNGLIPFIGVESLVAPLYGGPSMLTNDPSQILAKYTGFTDKTLFLIDRKIARDTLLGKAAVIRAKMGEGHLYLFGPHFEHPHFPVANKLLADAMYWDVRSSSPPKESIDRDEMNIQGCNIKDYLRDIKREISNSRIVNAGMETMPVHWTIGNKIYEPAKIRVFIEAIWLRIKILEKVEELTMRRGNDALLIQHASEITSLLREIKRHNNKGIDTLNIAKKLFKILNKTCSLFLDMYFRSKIHHFGQQNEA
ncbi:MAG: hypothetical protein HQ551_05815 [Desulfobacteraceae bacterium]|nr:hypothetical protein [Desulfobacteraceae bacterium]